jgi:hypothetical protein
MPGRRAWAFLNRSSVPFTVGLVFFFPLWCGGAPGYFPRLPTPTLSPLLFLDDTTRISQHTTSMGGHPAWDLNPADLAVVSGECRSSFHHPTVSPY